MDKTEALLKEYQANVRSVAFGLISRLPANERMDDLVQEGMLAFYLAIGRYEENSEATLWSYARPRVEGAMLDYLRAKAPMARSAYAKRCVFAVALQALQHDLMREPTSAELAEKLQISLAQFREDAQACTITIYSLEAFQDVDDEQVDTLDFTQIEDEDSDPEYLLMWKQRFTALADRLARLPERNQQVMRWLLEDDYNLKQIGERLGITESRVCQLRGTLASALHDRLKDY